MERAPMPARSSWMRLCGKPFDSKAAAGNSPRGKAAGARVERCPDKTCGKWHVRAGATAAVPVLRPPRRAPGFSARVKLAVRIRSGNGDIEAAACESCGRLLGRRNGQVHHLAGRGMGGCKDPLVNSPANAALLCGDPFTGCHGLATAFDAGIGAKGFWLKRGTDLLLAPMTLHSGRKVLRSLDGRYLDAPLGTVAA